MAIPEAQLDTWSKQGSVTQSKNTYATVKTCLEKADAPYAGKSFTIFLQGSYGNDTNIYSDSDVDVVIATDSIYYYDLDELPEDQKEIFRRNLSGASYTYQQFKADVLSHLQSNFGQTVKAGKKAIFIPENGARRDCDVLPAAESRRYYRYVSASDNAYHRGITFWTPDGTKIVNYPKQHSENCTAKHQATSSWFKPCVRILKNMRNSMISKDYLEEGIAPSYFIEGMIYNVPNKEFGGSYQDSIVNAINWLINCDRSKLLCANERYMLLHPESPVTWRAEHMQTYLDAVVKFWQAW
jgi:hypothetical protein